MPLNAASNFLTNTQCSCASPLICDHGQIFAVKVSSESLGRLSSSIRYILGVLVVGLEIACIVLEYSCNVV